MSAYTLDIKWYVPFAWSEAVHSKSFGPSREWNLEFRPDVSGGIFTNRLSLCRQRSGLRLMLRGHLSTNSQGPINFEASMDRLDTFVSLPFVPQATLMVNRDRFVKITVYVTEMEPSDQETNVNEKKVQTESDFNILDVRGKPIATIDTNALTSLSRDMQTMYEENHHSDFTLICGSETFHAHKCVLSARSPVFASMLQHPMNETAENRMIIPDIDALVLNQLILFMYTGHINELSYPTARDLYSASDKYAVLQLKDKCSQFIISSLSTSTAVEILILGDMHSDSMLKNAAISYISDNFKELNTTEAWLTLVKERSPLAVEVLSSAMTHLNSKFKNGK